MPPYSLYNPYFSNELLFNRVFSRQARASGASMLRKLRDSVEENVLKPAAEAGKAGASLLKESALRMRNTENEEPEEEVEEEETSNTKNAVSSAMKTIVKGFKNRTRVSGDGRGGEEGGSMFQNIEQPVEDMMKTVSNKTSIPFIVVFFIFLLIVGVFAIVFFCCLKNWWRKFRGKEGKGGGFMGGKVDLKSVQLLGQAYKEKVQPDMEELTKDMEQNEAGKEEAKEEVKLGRLQFKIDYDFNQSTVSNINSVIFFG